MKKWKFLGLDLVIVAALIGIDQWTKYLAVTHIKGNGVVSFIPHVLQLRYIENTGGAFSFMEDSVIFFSVVTSLFLIGLTIAYIWYNYKHEKVSFIYHAVFVLVLAGGIGNLIDRIALGYVVDFLEFAFFNFPIFNVADIYVTTVMIALVCYLINDEIKKTRHIDNSAV